ncbi:MAG: glycoside hydrolase family protein [Pseudomonadota bacterium]
MKPRLKSSRAARDLIKAHEPFHGAAVQRGRTWVVGYGHTAAAREGAAISPDDAELLLLYDVLQAETAITETVGADLPDAVFDALVSFACSMGTGAFKVSDVARLARDGQHREAAAALETWVRAQENGRLVVSETLARRRAAEKALYLSALDDDAPVIVEEAAAQPDAPAPVAEPVELDIQFEEPTVEAPAMEPHAEPVEELQEPDLEAEPEPEPESAPEPEAELADETAAEDETGLARARQDAVMQAVLARMAGDMARSAAAQDADAEDLDGAEDEAEDETPPQAPVEAVPASHEPRVVHSALGYSFLKPWQQSVDTEEAGEEGAAPVQPTTGEVAAADPAPVEDEPSAPPAAGGPAAAPGMSGEVAGVRDPGAEDASEATEEDEGEREAEDELHPGLVAGPEAGDAEPEQTAEEPTRQARGDWVFFANLLVGLGLLGAGGWDLASHFDTYREQGFFYFGPVAFAAGLVLTVASAWFVLGRRSSRAKAGASRQAPTA